MSRKSKAPTHWADNYAERVIREKGPLDKDKKRRYTCASGITPSGTVHIGNFREIISVDLVVRALRDRGVPVRFIYSWDDYDAFRKVPKNIPEPDAFREYLRMPITRVPDPWDRHDSYARAHEMELETLLPTVGIEPEYLYQAERYGSGQYAAGIRRALEHRDRIRAVLNEFRTDPLPEGWWPVIVFSRFTWKDTTTIVDWDGEWELTYRCDDTGGEETVDLRTADCVKLPWRVDWPMRWAAEDVDFEPAGKEHHSAGGSFDTAGRICREIYNVTPPVTFKYDFIGIKGRGGKISSSTGEVIGLNEVLEIYQPEVVRYLFASTRPNSEFQISFDLDVIKIYEDYDRSERIHFGVDHVGEARRIKESRIYELSQVREIPQHPPIQIPFRHLCNLLLIVAGDVERAVREFPGVAEADPHERERLERRAWCAWNWICNYAPEEFRFRLNDGTEEPLPLKDAEREAVRALAQELRERFDMHDEKTLQNKVYELARERELEPAALFETLYRVLIGKDRGPRLGGFLITIGKERVLAVLSRY